MIIEVKKLDLPKELTAQEWDKNKGLVAKILGKTGIGAALKVLATARAEVVKPLQIADFPADHKVMPKMTLEQWAAIANKKANDFMELVKKLSDAADKVADLAEAASAKFAKNKLVPKGSANYATTVASKAKTYKSVVDSIKKNNVTGVAAKETQRIKNEIAEMNKLVFKGQWSALTVAVGKITKAKIDAFTGQVKENAGDLWQDFVYQPARTIVAGLHNLKELDPTIAKVCEHHTKVLGGMKDNYNWTSLGGNEKLITKVFGEVQDMAEDVGKLAKKFA